MSKLEDLIRARKEDFNDNFPPDGHFERFKKKLPLTRTIGFSFLQMASVIIFGLLITSVSIYFIRSLNSDNRMYASHDDELKEVLYYYEGLNSEMEQKILEMEFEDNSEKEALLKDIENYDEGLNQIEEDLKKFPNDERVRNAAISHQKGKTALLNIIISQ
ncbi:MAG: hypothetical protein K9H12_03890 [Bacteroidales bacterium]|nr:hypothetical protein [Bacteroidales bacterium]